MIRITGGKFKQKKLFSINDFVRPTSSLKREAFFSIIESYAIKKSIELYKNKIFLDLFAGIGTMGLEAISRGISEVIFFENNKLLNNVSGVWVRFLKNGTIEEITTKLTILHLLDESKIYVHNSGVTIEKTVDKIRTTGILEVNNIKSPETTIWFAKNKKKTLSVGGKAHHCATSDLQERVIGLKATSRQN